MKKIRYIYSENPLQKMWDTFVYFENEPAVKQFLTGMYENNQIGEPTKYAFVNTSKFIYLIKQAKEYFFSAEKSNILVKPLLEYYGMMSLIKAIILTKDPQYPNKTGVLRHGITTRKLKKTNFQFHDDEVKIQKDGLLPLFYTISTGNDSNYIEGKKYKIKDLLSLLPDLIESYSRLFNEQLMYPIKLNYSSDYSVELLLPIEILNSYENDQNRFLLELNLYNNSNNPFLLKNSLASDYITITWSGSLFQPLKYANPFSHPMIIQDIKGRYFISKKYTDELLLPEIIIDYMLMYNLGMLCRYETEIWGELLFSFSSEDMYIVNEFVNLTLRKFPNLVLNDLFGEFLIFNNN